MRFAVGAFVRKPASERARASGAVELDLDLAKPTRRRSSDDDDDDDASEQASERASERTRGSGGNSSERLRVDGSSVVDENERAAESN